MTIGSTGFRPVALLLAGLALDGGVVRPVPAAALETTLATAPLARVVDGVESFTLAEAEIALQSGVASSGPGWRSQKFTGAAGSLTYTDAADYFFVADVTGIDGVPLEDVVGPDFAGFVRGKLHAQALATPNPRDRIYILQKEALRAAEPLFRDFLDPDVLEVDPYEHLDRVICVPMPVAGALLEPSFSPDVVIREDAGVLDYYEGAASGLATDLGPLLGSVDLRALRSSTLLAAPATGSGGAPAGAVAQSATAEALTCFNLRDTLGDGEGGSCKVDLLRPDTWYREHTVKRTLEVTIPSTSVEATLDTSQGLGKALLATYYDGTARYEAGFSFQNDAGRGVGGRLEVRVGSLFCVPLWLQPVAGRLWAHATASSRLEVHGTLKVPAEDVAQVAELDPSVGGSEVVRDPYVGAAPAGDLPDPYTLMEHTLVNPAAIFVVPMPPPIPIVLIVDFPVEIGLIAGIDSPTLTNFWVEGSASLGFDYSCRFSGSCEAIEPFALTPVLDGHVDGDVGIEGRAFLKPYAGVNVRASLYLPGAIYAKAGPRAYANVELWGASKPCGDADGNSQAEWVNAMAVDGDVGLEALAEVGVFDVATGVDFIDDRLQSLDFSIPLAPPFNLHLFLETLSDGADPFQPMLAAPASIQEDATATLGARMRPCYPWKDEIEYELAFGDGTPRAEIDGKPQESVSASHVWANPNSYPVHLTAVRDAHQRNLAGSVRRTVAVTPKPVLKTTTLTTIRR
jgi:hypothetical protein